MAEPLFHTTYAHSGSLVSVPGIQPLPPLPAPSPLPLPSTFKPAGAGLASRQPVCPSSSLTVPYFRWGCASKTALLRGAPGHDGGSWWPSPNPLQGRARWATSTSGPLHVLAVCLGFHAICKLVTTLSSLLVGHDVFGALRPACVLTPSGGADNAVPPLPWDDTSLSLPPSFPPSLPLPPPQDPAASQKRPPSRGF